jgi:Tol biopolymer transport system component
MTLLPGDTLNSRYRIVAIIAEGGMSAVYRAFDETLHIPVAVKESYLEGEGHFRQFRLEATILAGLRHPNLPRVTDHFILPGQGQYLVMDFIEGEDLRHILAHRGSLPENEIVVIGAAACDALAYLHSRTPPIIHRDVKPGNVKITPGGGVYLVDFGLAKIAQPDQSTQTGAQGLTPGFAPPEQYGQGTGTRSDIYSLGATLYAGLCGKTPEDGLSRAMGSAELTPLRSRNSEISERMAAAIERALAVNPDERYPFAEDFREAILRAAEDGALKPAPQPIAPPTPQQPADPPPMPTPAIQRFTEAAAALPKRQAPPGWLLPALAGFFILAAAAAILIIFSSSAGRAATLPASSLATATLPASAPTTSPVTPLPAAILPSPTPPPAPSLAPTPTPAPSVTSSPAVTPLGGGGGLIAFSSSRGGIPQVWTMQADGSNPQQVTQLKDGACQPDWSPDGARIVFISPCNGKKDEYPGASLFIINANGSGLIPLVTLPGGDFDPAWSPDGERIAFASLRDGRFHIFIYNLADNRVTRVSRPATYERRPAWSPDGERLAYETNRSGTPQVWVVEADGTNAQPFANSSGGRSTMPAWSPDGSLLVYTQGGNPTFLVSRVWGESQAVEQHVSEVHPVENARFSPDGRWVVFNSSQDGDEEIYIMLLSGGNLTRLTKDHGLDFHPAWQP